MYTTGFPPEQLIRSRHRKTGSPYPPIPPATRSTRRALLALLTIALLLVSSRGAWAVRDYPFFQNDYDGDPHRVLAVLNGQPITERDIFLFMLMARMPNPDLAEGWESPTWAPVREDRTEVLRQAVELYATSKLLSRFPADTPDFFVDYLATRWHLYPVFSMVWTRSVIAPRIVVAPEDIVYHLRRNEGLYSLPDRFEFAWASIAARDSESRSAARQRLEALRGEAFGAGATLDELLAQSESADFRPTTTLQQINGAFVLARGSREIDPLLGDTLSRMHPGELSEVLQTREALHLLQLRAVLPQTLRPAEEVRPEAERFLRHQFRKLFYGLELVELADEFHPVNRVKLWDHIADETPMIVVRDSSVTKGQFKAMFPVIFNRSSPPPNAAYIRDTADELAENELIARDVETRALDDDQLLRDAKPIAEMTARAHRAYRRSLAEYSQPDDETLLAWWKDRRGEIMPDVERHYLKFSASLNRTRFRVGDADSERREIAELHKALSGFQQEAQLILTAQRGTAATGEGLDKEPLILRWEAAVGAPWKRQVEDLGFRPVLRPGPAPIPSPDLPFLPVGTISRPRYETGGTLSVYAVIDERPVAVPPPQAELAAAQSYYKGSILARELRRRLDDLTRDGRFVWDPALAPRDKRPGLSPESDAGIAATEAQGPAPAAPASPQPPETAPTTSP